MKKIISMLMALTLSLGILTGCTSKDGAGKDSAGTKKIGLIV